MLLTALTATALAAPMPGLAPAPCGTLEQLPLSPRVRTLESHPLPLNVAGNKSVRDPFGTPNEHQSENFVVHWGNSGGVSSAEVTRLLDAFELAWQVQIESLGSTAPYGTGQYKFNVYIGDTGDGAPGGYGTGGYYTVDWEGWPVIVVSNATLSTGEFADHTAAHEFYHAVQGATERFDYQGLGAWFWEATAEWAAIETDPSNGALGSFVFGYLLLPELPVNFFDYPDTGALQEYHQYGAFVFPHYLTETTGDIDLIGDAWASGGAEQDPMEVLRSDLAAAGEDLDALWLDHIAHNVVYDYDLGDQWRTIVDTYAPFYPDANPVLATWNKAGMEAEERVKGRDAPYRYGYNAIHLKNPDAGTLEVFVEGDPEGKDGSPASFGARVVRVDGGVPSYLEVPFDGTTGTLSVEDIGSADEAWLVVGAWTTTAGSWEDERFPYAYSLVVTPPPEEPVETGEPGTGSGTTPGGDPSSPGGGEAPIACGCASGTGGTAGWLIAPLGLLALRRRG